MMEMLVLCSGIIGVFAAFSIAWLLGTAAIDLSIHFSKRIRSIKQ